ncbi:hypothetical protein [Streptomyces sp. NBC_01408]|uniref:hypothetical protein n=1 Tax=Streptomyces sp. NBC_01408 TaxID=2903855 RepID=UPI002254999E|nr:hypothetical protein [Streptomyces sp. NBC_01408]MCX4693766.1 hypothetical protein [Streptomyces sp. NBC_01408]
MNIPDWLRWGLAAFAAFQLLGAYSALRKVRAETGARRTDAKLNLADGLACATMFTGLAAGQVVVAACGLAVQGPVLLTQLIRWYRARSEPAPDSPSRPADDTSDSLA